ncbi:unconventional myosin-Ic-like [Gordionus sp. m RMFG-2023]|uniref:unconventional myosin-Ic-like n=1 Tax=Gordionus sp. m RMFG-2023 TaxID=3053472 RepID=UPI0031FBEF9C
MVDDESIDINLLLNTVGIDNFVLLEDYRSIEAFDENLHKRFDNDNIYTYIGQILLSVNPFRKIPGICSKKMMMKYKTTNLLELPPHIFALSQNAYVSLLNESNRQSVLISGESGAGKTECLKQILLYISSTSHQTTNIDRIRKQLNSSVPILEAFGNAKTIRNDNSSRFGKYMELQFDAMGSIIGANVTNYLLEKSRTISQSLNERNYHIFYQMLKADKPILDHLNLEANPDKYNAISHGKSAKVSTIDDVKDFKEVHEGLKVCEFSEEEIMDLFGVVAAVLHLGEMEISEVEKTKSKIESTKVLKWISECLKCSESDLAGAICTKEVKTEKETVYKDLTKAEAIFVKDSMAKAIFSRTFNWLVERTNKIMKADMKCYFGKIGLLDIYGFEIFQNNSFEQLCINYCNEKLHQLFVERTLKLEQEEYIREGIKWETVDYFNNKPILIFIEEKNGVISSLDEECILPGNRTDETFLQKLEENFKAFEYFTTQKLTKDPKLRKALGRTDFSITHYAGPVTYNITNFLEKNKDLLYRNMKKVLIETKHSILSKCFTEVDLDVKKRPDTEATQFKSSLQKLIDVLIQDDLHYIRCLKPNDIKAPKTYDQNMIKNQIRYLGLLESLCVCRSGYAYRRPYNLFNKRYYITCPKTFPKYAHLDPKAATTDILDGMSFVVNEDYQFGKTKVSLKIKGVITN